MTSQDHKSVARVISELLTTAILCFGLGALGISRSCEREKDHRVEACMARHLLGETNQYNPHLGCLRKKKDGHWEKVKDL